MFASHATNKIATLTKYYACEIVLLSLALSSPMDAFYNALVLDSNFSRILIFKLSRKHSLSFGAFIQFKKNNIHKSLTLPLTKYNLWITFILRYIYLMILKRCSASKASWRALYWIVKFEWKLYSERRLVCRVSRMCVAVRMG